MKPLLCASLAALVIGAGSARAQEVPPALQLPEARAPRARDPWVFRSVLDKRPRMITLALNEELWAAYDATTCTLYKAWKGGVHFDGAVYTTVHGPQPTSQGSTYTEGVPGSAWGAAVNGVSVPVNVSYLGYVVLQERVTLHYSIELPDGRKLHVQEIPEFVLPEDMYDAETRAQFGVTAGHPGLDRKFKAHALPADVKLSLSVRSDGATAKHADMLEKEQFIDVEDAQGNKTTQVISQLVLIPERPYNRLTLFFAPLELPPAPAPVEEAVKEDKPGGGA